MRWLDRPVSFHSIPFQSNLSHSSNCQKIVSAREGNNSTTWLERRSSPALFLAFPKFCQVWQHARPWAPCSLSELPPQILFRTFTLEVHAEKYQEYHNSSVLVFRTNFLVLELQNILTTGLCRRSSYIDWHGSVVNVRPFTLRNREPWLENRGQHNHGTSPSSGVKRYFTPNEGTVCRTLVSDTLTPTSVSSYLIV